ncbi:MAG TPA: glutamate racemase [Syntrophobacteraceae bacterium]|nr:glutamate racemase [Syntrophobacteraceae bacterium]
MTSTSHPDNPIGVFDSGIGGLTVVSALLQRLPEESIIYFGDTARVPYGIKSAATIEHYAAQITEFLLLQRVKVLIIACNTMAAVAYQAVKDLAPVPVLEVIEAGARGVLTRTRNKRVGIIGTPVTIHSGAYVRAIHRHDPEIRIFPQACPLFVPLVEEGWLSHPVTRLTSEEYLQSLLAERIDTLVLGCTHYPLLKPLLQQVVGPDVTLVDSAEAMADQLASLLDSNHLRRGDGTRPEHRFYVTDVPHRFQEVGERLLGRRLGKVVMHTR